MKRLVTAVFVFYFAFLTASICTAADRPVWGQWPQWGDLGNGTYRNPVLPADYSDIDITQVGSDYYAISSTFQFSPGMVILHSKDLINWRTVGHAVTDLTQIGPELNWDRMDRYSRGIWAGAIRFHAGKFWIYFGTPDEGYFMTSATNVAGPWAPLHRVLPAAGWDDCAPFWDDDGQGYFVGTNFKDGYKIHLWKMTADNRDLVPESDQIIYQSKGSEANKLYKIKGTYYHFFSEVKSEGRVIMMQRAKNILGPYTEQKQLKHADHDQMDPNQGGFVEGPDKKWYFFTHHGRGVWEGRAASLLPVTWIDGWPIVGTPGADGIGSMVWEGRKPLDGAPVTFPQGSDEFSDKTLAPVWEWNYQPRAEKWSLTERPGFMRLHAFRGLDGDNLLKVGNVLTQRSVRAVDREIVVRLELDGLVDGQHAGLCHFTAMRRRDQPATSTASLGAVQVKGERFIEISRNGTFTRGPALGNSALWVKSAWGLDGISRFSFSLDGIAFTPFGESYPLVWGSYRGDRVGLFTFNNTKDAGFIDFDWVHYEIVQPTSGTF